VPPLQLHSIEHLQICKIFITFQANWQFVRSPAGRNEVHIELVRSMFFAFFNTKDALVVVVVVVVPAFPSFSFCCVPVDVSLTSDTLLYITWKHAMEFRISKTMTSHSAITDDVSTDMTPSHVCLHVFVLLDT
jgi:hypothetical protein